MSDLFITQLAADTSTVCLITSSALLSPCFQDLATTQQLELLTLTPEQVLAGTLDQVPNIYKIVWVVEPSLIHDVDQQLLTYLAGRSEPLLVVELLMTSITGQMAATQTSNPTPALTSAVRDWVYLSSVQDHYFSQLWQVLPQAQHVWVMNVVESPSFKKSWGKWWSSDLDQGVVYDPALMVGFQSVSMVSQEIGNVFFRPKTNNGFLITTKAVSTGDAAAVVARLYDQYYHQSLEPEIVALQPAAALLPSHKQRLTPAPSLTDILAPAVRALPLVTVNRAARTTRSVSDLPSPAMLTESPHIQNNSTRVVITKQPPVSRVVAVPPPARVVKIPPRQPVRVKAPVVQKRTVVQHINQRSTPSSTQSAMQVSSAHTIHTGQTDRDTTGLTTRVDTTHTATLSPTLSLASSPQNSPPSSQAPLTEAHLDQAVQSLFSSYRSQHKVARVQNLAQDTVTITQKSRRKKRVFYGGLGLLGAVLGVMTLSMIYGASRLVVISALPTLFTAQQQPLPAWKKTMIATSARVLRAQAEGYSSVVGDEVFAEDRLYAAVVTNLQAIQPQMSDWQEAVSRTVLKVLATQEGLGLEDQDLFSQSSKLYQHLSQLQAELKKINPQFLSDQAAQSLTTYQEYLTEQRKSLATAQQLQSLYPTLLGYQQPRTYAVLFQNNQELRPTGGFIQAVALVTVDKGSVIDTQVLSVYDLDAKLVGAVKPPDDIKEFLGEQQWYVRDSNWNPDFPTTAAQVGWFIDKTTGKKVDGVIALNLYVLQDMIKAIGPVELPEYNEVITDRNLAERMEFHSEIQFAETPGKTDYSSLLLTKILAKLSRLPAEKASPLLLATGQALTNNQLLVSLLNQAENQTLTSLGWTGSLLTPQCPPQLSSVPCVVDTFAQVESNIGINKANAHIERKISHNIRVSRPETLHTHTVEIKNNSSSNAWPKGPYKLFIRFYVSSAAQLKSLKVNQVEVGTTQIIQRDESGKKVFGVVVEIPIQSTQTLELVYAVPQIQSGSFSYAFLNQNQPGVETASSSLAITYSDPLKPQLIAPQAEMVGSNIIFNPNTMGHFFAGVQFK